MGPVAVCVGLDSHDESVRDRLARLDPKWRGLAQRLRQGGKSGSLVAAAVANRWVRWLFHQLQPKAVA